MLESWYRCVNDKPLNSDEFLNALNAFMPIFLERSQACLYGTSTGSDGCSICTSSSWQDEFCRQAPNEVHRRQMDQNGFVIKNKKVAWSILCPCSSVLLLFLLAPILTALEQSCADLSSFPIRISRSLRTLQAVQTPDLCREECVNAPRCEAYRINDRGCEY